MAPGRPLRPARVLIPEPVEKQIAALMPADSRKVERALRGLESEPLSGKALKGPLEGKRSARAGRDLRVLYRFDPAIRTVFVLDVGPRGAAY